MITITQTTTIFKLTSNNASDARREKTMKEIKL